jgi:putative hydrolase of the HAD superfamily
MFCSTTRPGIEGIVIDAVGTLIEPWPSVADVYSRVALRQRITLETSLVRRRFRRALRNDEGSDDISSWVTDEELEQRRWRGIVGEVLTEIPDPEAAFIELWEHFGDPKSWRVFDDVAPALRGLHDAGLSICIGSNFDARLRRVVAGLPMLSDWGGLLVVSSEIGYRKPHPEFFKTACDRLGCEPSRVMCVGDDLELDVRGARRAGLRAVLLDRFRKHSDVEDAPIFGLDALVSAVVRST